MILHRKNSGSDAFKNNCIPYAVKGRVYCVASVLYLGYIQIKNVMHVYIVPCMQFHGTVTNHERCMDPAEDLTVRAAWVLHFSMMHAYHLAAMKFMYCDLPYIIDTYGLIAANNDGVNIN